jgi:NPCBM/NEW2 domain-containing protein
MKQSPRSSTQPPGVPEAHEADTGRLTEKVNALFGVAGGVFTVLTTAGFIFLPTSTTAEQGLVLGACLSVSAAAASGLGAWRSGRRFAITAVLVTSALACLACLASAARDDGAAGLPLATGQEGAAQGATSRASPLSTSNPGAAHNAPAVPPTQDLMDMTPVNGSGIGFKSGPQEVDTSTYDQTLYIDVSDGINHTITYQLNRQYTRFHAIVGPADSSPSSISVTFRVLVDGHPVGVGKTLQVGQTAQINVDVTGAFRLTLQDYGPYSFNSVTAVWIKPTIIR